MRSAIVYESMFGNTHLIANAIAEGLRSVGDVSVVPVGQANPALLDGVDLLVVGGPTHAHGMSRPSTRAQAVGLTEADEGLELDPDATGESLREWFTSLPELNIPAAAFDTRFDAPALITGRASKAISRHLVQHGCRQLAKPRSFFVRRGNLPEPAEAAAAAVWGEQLARLVSTVAAP
jgi:hypothetical protein